eukprot:CCRYP_014794-RB/>CCRYP_014794-RB protein AED:0.00 eAED:0.00 QI:1118/1/1/1/1/1/2/122/560
MSSGRYPKASAASLSSDATAFCNKENNMNFATQARSYEEEQLFRPGHHREPFQPIHSNAAIVPAQRLPKKIRHASHPLSRKSNRTSDSTTKSGLDTSEENAIETPAATVPVDPPGAVLGALPWMPPNAGFSASNVYEGRDHQSFATMANWAFQPLPNVRHAHGWTFPPFLAPLAAAVRHPFADSTDPHNLQLNGRNPYRGNCHPGASHHCAPVEMEDTCTRVEPIATEEAIASLKDDFDIKMADSELPSTFAPTECVEKIRSRRLKDGRIELMPSPKTQPSKTVQGRVMTRSASKAVKNFSEVVVAHQASSPVVTREKASPSKSTRVNPLPNAVSTPAEVITILGKRVTMIDPVRKVFIIDLLSPEECDDIRMMADNHTIHQSQNGSHTPVWRTLYTYTKMDLPVCEVTDMREKYTDRILLDVKRIVGEVFGKKREAMALRPRSWKEPHMLLYQALEGKPHHTGIEMHYDGCDITWQAMLTRNDEYEGGGTYFRCLRKTVLLRQGQVLVHPGELYHKGIDVTYGVRCLLVCFTDGFSPKIMDDSKQHEDDPKYEKNVCLY